MSPSVLLCTLLLTFSTSSPVDINALSLEEQPQTVSDLQAELGDLASLFRISESMERLTVPSSRVTVSKQVVEQWWNVCLDKISAYSHSQDFFINDLPVLIGNLAECDTISSPLEYNADTLSATMKLFCEQKSYNTWFKDLVQIAIFFNDGRGPFEGLSDEFLTLAAKYIRSTFGIRRLYSLVEDPDAFPIPYRVEDPQLLERQLLSFLVSLKSLLKGLQEADPMGAYKELSNAIRATRKTMVPANKAFLGYFTDDLAEKISLLAEKVSEAISARCDQFNFAKMANNLLYDIETITLPLYRAHLDLSRGAAEQRESGQVLWHNFLESLFAFESILVKPTFDISRRVSETCSEFLDYFLDAFLRGEDEPWTFGLHAKLTKTQILWRRATKAISPLSDILGILPWLKYTNRFSADLSVIFNIVYVVEKLDDPLALDRPTREKFVEFWRETQAMLRLLRSFEILTPLTKLFKIMEQKFGVAFVKKSLSDILDGPISVLQRHGINFQLGTYHQFINDLPEHQGAIAQSMKKASDFISHIIIDNAVVSQIEIICSHLTLPVYTPLRRSLTQLFQNPPRPAQPQDPTSHSFRSNKKQPKVRGKRSKRRIKSRTGKAQEAVVPQARASTTIQGFVPSSSQSSLVHHTFAEDDPTLFEETPENPWTLVRKSRRCQTSERLVDQSALKVLKKFTCKPLGWDGIPPTDPRDMRSDKTKVKIATFNAEWLFLFNLSTEKLAGKIEWRSLTEAWKHIRDVADAIRKIDADIICLCEVQDLRILSILVELLPELNYRAYLIPNHDSLGQNVGILTRVDTHASISRIDERFFPKNIVFHLRLDNGSGELVDLVLTGVHLISSAAEADHSERARQRRDQAKALKQHLALNHDTSGETIHLVLGDFNMVDSELLSAQPAHPSEEALEVVKQDDFKLFNIMNSKTASRDRAALADSVCHIFTTHPRLADESQLFGLNEDIASYRLERVSDHLPIVTTIRLLTHNQ